MNKKELQTVVEELEAEKAKLVEVETEQSQRIEELEARIEELEARIEELEVENQSLKDQLANPETGFFTPDKEMEQEKEVVMIWEGEPAITIDGSQPTRLGFELKKDAEGNQYAMVPESRVPVMLHHPLSRFILPEDMLSDEE